MTDYTFQIINVLINYFVGKGIVDLGNMVDHVVVDTDGPQSAIISH